jgi:molybdopterin molybdotransferase
VVGVLKEIGVNLFFEKVAMRPGKPIVFGKYYKTAVFALPGNPVATYVSFELFARPAIRKMMGFTQLGRTVMKAHLETPLRGKKERREFRPAWLRMEDGKFFASAVEWHGSADLLGTTRGNSLLIVPEGTESLSVGQEVEVMLTGEL